MKTSGTREAVVSLGGRCSACLRSILDRRPGNVPIRRDDHVPTQESVRRSLKGHAGGNNAPTPTTTSEPCHSNCTCAHHPMSSFAPLHGGSEARSFDSAARRPAAAGFPQDDTRETGLLAPLVRQRPGAEASISLPTTHPPAPTRGAITTPLGV